MTTLLRSFRDRWQIRARRSLCRAWIGRYKREIEEIMADRDLTPDTRRHLTGYRLDRLTFWEGALSCLSAARDSPNKQVSNSGQEATK
jgi:hypothetical protein